jgi:chorismate mutase/prephenate dehydratase
LAGYLRELSMAKAKKKKKAAKSAAIGKPTPSKKKPAAKAGAVDAAAPKEKPLTPLEKIAQLDHELVKLIQERGRIVKQLAKRSDAAVAGVCALGAGSDQLTDEAIGRGRGPLSRQSLRAVFREVHSGCRSLIRKSRVAFLGPTYSYSHLAAIHSFGQSVEFVTVGSIPAVFEEVNRGLSDFGLVPIENSTDGRIVDTLDMFTRLPVKICGEVDMEIHHALLGKCPRTEVREVYSRPQALSQCRNWLAKHLPAARTIEVTSTSTAAQLAKEKPATAAIASFQAGIYYGLDVLAERIEDNLSNTTRFAIIGNRPPERTENDKTAILFQVEHRPGGLAEAMNIFKSGGLNLTWIESFPIPGPDRGYLFFMELEGHESDKPVQKALATLGRKALRLEVLGSFPATEVVE